MSMTSFWDEQHKKRELRYLSDYSGDQVWKYLMVESYLVPNINILNIGVGTGRCTRHLKEKGINVYALDISKKALGNVEQYTKGSWLTTEYDKIPTKFFDVVLSHLVVQHMTDEDILKQLKYVLRSLKKEGIFAFQYASPHPDDYDSMIYIESIEYQEAGAILRKKAHMKELIERAGGEIVKENNTVPYDNEYARCSWNACIIREAVSEVLK